MKHNEEQKKQLRLPCIVDQINRIRDLVISDYIERMNRNSFI